MEWILAGLLRESSEGRGQAVEACADCFRISAEADAKVLWLLEKFSGNNAGLELIMEKTHKVGGVAHFEAGEHSCAEATGRTIELRLMREEIVHQHAIRFAAECGRDCTQDRIVEDNHGEKLGWMDGASVG